MQKQKFEGRSAEMKADSPWLAAEDILGLPPLSVKIKEVFFNKNVKFDKGRTEDRYSLAFEGKKKELLVNSTNRKRLVNMFGPESKEWAGKTIKLYTEKTNLMGEIVDGIRIVDTTQEAKG